MSTALSCSTHPPRTSHFTRLKNWETGDVFHDTLHMQSTRELPCGQNSCFGSIMFPEVLTNRSPGESEDPEKLLNSAVNFINQYYSSIKRFQSEAHQQRLRQVQNEIHNTGTYQLEETELIYGARMAWRNAPRCIGRIQWTRLQVFDARDCTSAQEMFEHICSHIKYSTNKGNIRSAITIFPQRRKGRGDFRVWNSLLIRYAGYCMPDGSVIGDPANVEITKICIQMGWEPRYGRFDVLPMILQAAGEEPCLFEIPPDLILEVPIIHPRYAWFADLGLKWNALPAVASLLLEIGGLEFTASPFNGWYLSSEIGSRNLCDANRYNILGEVAKHMALDTKTNLSLWKDQATVEVNIAVLHSFQVAKVTVMDHHTASESFMKHMQNEFRERGGCPADWVWIVPPISGSVTPVFHQEMLNYIISPFFWYQPDPWKNNDYKNKKKISFRKVAEAIKFSASLMSHALAKRVKVRILYATETGKSETFARLLHDVFKKAFYSRVICMNEYDHINLQHENLVLVVASTFGNGDPPESGESFAKALMDMSHPAVKQIEQKKSYKVRFNSLSSMDNILEEVKRSSELDHTKSPGPLSAVRYSVFGLGSRAYPHFCAFGHAVDTLLHELGGECILEMGEGDELCGQEESFRTWASDVFKAACQTFCVEQESSLGLDTCVFAKSMQWQPEKCRRVTAKKPMDLVSALSKIHKKKVLLSWVISRQNLQSESSCRETILLRLDTRDQEKLQYVPGDHLGIFPTNRQELVDAVLARVIDPPPINENIVLETLEENNGVSSWARTDRLPPCTLRQALSHFLDLTSTPSPQFLSSLLLLATSSQDKKRLSVLTQAGREYDHWKWNNAPTLEEVLQEFPSVMLPTSLLLSQLPLLKPRYYSISSSSAAHPGEVHITVAVVQYRSRDGKGPLHQGVCSTWLNHTKPGDMVPCFIRGTPTFHLPDDDSVPCILVGPGTGIAPFRGFWQQRQYEIEQQGKKPGDMILVFGCRKSEWDHIYREDVEEAKSKGALSAVYTAYSRETTTKVYVQDILQQQMATLVFQTLYEQNGHMYVCGDVNMAKNVLKTVQQIVASHSGMALSEAGDYLSKLRDQQRIHEDIFGVTLRTQEVTSQARNLFSLRYEKEPVEM
ncbi:nitric oxide synthase, endothelial-like [Polypterus senegalus]|nr:nitric oxide synthase, endothelial-like [Polypterus senegalus]